MYVSAVGYSLRVVFVSGDRRPTYLPIITYAFWECLTEQAIVYFPSHFGVRGVMFVRRDRRMSNSSTLNIVPTI